ncbi:MAG: very short patch repair endonuclease [Planctomycetes bacterium]|nr:very short patch repair endonuclease [Planctomycetota bacterium]
MGMSRSDQMARIRGYDTAPELLLRRALRARGIYYRLHYKVPVGRPDLIIPGRRLVVFVDGCFWHGCPTHYVRPRSGGVFWAEKLAANVDRDRRHTACLEEEDWTVLRFWEHELSDVEAVVDTIEATIQGREGRRSPAWRVMRVEVVDNVRDLERRCLVDLRDPDAIRMIEGTRYGRGGPKPRLRRRHEG